MSKDLTNNIKRWESLMISILANKKETCFVIWYFSRQVFRKAKMLLVIAGGIEYKMSEVLFQLFRASTR